MIPAGNICDRCQAGCSLRPENEYGEIICDNCEQNAAEAAWERHCEDFHDGGRTVWGGLQRQLTNARRLK